MQKGVWGGGKILKYIILSFLYPVFFYLFIFPLLDLQDAPQASLLTILVSMKFKGVYWFLFTLGVLYVINAITKHFKMGKYLALLLFITPFLSNQIWSFYLLINPEVTIPFWGHWGMLTLYSYLYFYLGDYLKQTQISRTSIVFVSIILCAIGWFLLVLDVYVFSNYYNEIYDGVNSSFCTFGALLLACGVFLLGKDLCINNRNVSNLIGFIGRNTMGVYVLHIFLIMFLRRYFLSEIVHPILAIFLSLCIVFFTSYISEVLCKTRLRFLFK